MSIAYVAFVAPCDVYLLCGICGFPSSSGSPHFSLSLWPFRGGGAAGDQPDLGGAKGAASRLSLPHVFAAQALNEFVEDLTEI